MRNRTIQILILLLSIGNLSAQTEKGGSITIPLSNPGEDGKLKMSLLYGSIIVIAHKGKDVIIETVGSKSAKPAKTKNGMRRIGDTSLQVGNKLVLNIGTTHYEGVVAYVGETLDPPADQYKYLKLTIKVPEIEPWLAVTYDESFVVKNSEGKQIFNIIESKIIPTERSVDTEDGRIVRSKDPYFKDAIIDVLVRVRCQENICYFNEFRPVKVGEYIWTQSEKSIISGDARIIDIEEVDS